MNHNNLWEIESLPMPITQKALQVAQQFATQQRHPQRHEQVYLNTLAVLAVRDYLKIIDIETDLTECDSWNPVIRLFADAGDLYVKGLGKIECRPIKNRPQTQETGNQNSSAHPPEICPVPVEARAERIGYIAVEIDEEEKEARLLGFSPNADAGELVLSELHSLDDFLGHLEHLLESQINLSQWLMNVFTADWLPFEAVFNQQTQTSQVEIQNPVESQLGNWWQNFVDRCLQQLDRGKQNLKNLISPDETPSFALRGGENSREESALQGSQSSINRFPEADVTRAKLIDLGMRLGRTTVALLVAIAEESDRTVRVHVQLHPAIGERYLPQNIKLSLISDIGKNLTESQSRIQERYILLKDIEVDRDESFSIRVALDDFSVTENFVV
ncbi:DUF1822 family protein [Microcoleus sp. B6-A1]|uniref:DUF1822 family protein n=1 Tax=Microcoleus sp. B6-A1 TaxID=2818684 RepID=UPI002FD44971